MKIDRTYFALILTFLFAVVFNGIILAYKAKFIGTINNFDFNYFVGELPYFLFQLALSYLIFFFLSKYKIVIKAAAPIIGGLSILSIIIISRYRKIINENTIADLLEFDIAQLREYMSNELILAVISLFAIISVFSINVKIRSSRKSSARSVMLGRYLTVLALIYVITFLTSADTARIKESLANYNPYNFALSVNKYRDFKFNYVAELSAKKDLYNDHEFLLRKPVEQLKVVLVIGESSRADRWSLNGYHRKTTPNLEKLSNLVSFNNAWSNSTSDREAIPYMLTRASKGEYKIATGEKSIISVFNELGFATSWIGAQSLDNLARTPHGTISHEANNIIHRKTIKKALSKKKVYDTDMLGFFSEAINQPGNSFTILHMMGNSWRFNERYPESFKKHNPTCSEGKLSNCSLEEISNSYDNATLHSDYFLGSVIEELKNSNAIVIYASDHGFSLGEKGIYGRVTEKGIDIPEEQLHIPMFVWASNKFIKANPGMLQKLKASSNKYISHDYLFHSILDCISIDSDVIDKNLSFCK